MSPLDAEIRAVLDATGEIPRERVLAWIRDARALSSLALLYRLTDEAYGRIVPELGGVETCGVIRRYLLTCIQLDPQDGSAATRYEAAQRLEVWFEYLGDKGEETVDILRETARAIADLYLVSGTEVQRAIETAFLEHVLEQERFRPHFEYWERDERLRGAWQRALAWAEAHPNFVSRLRARKHRV
jgi:hypothetical protein